jgi:hypothetical protein
VGTAADSLRLPATLPPAYLNASRLWHRRDGGWREMSGAAARIAEYRTPEFLLNVSAPVTTAR